MFNIIRMKNKLKLLFCNERRKTRKLGRPDYFTLSFLDSLMVCQIVHPFSVVVFFGQSYHVQNILQTPLSIVAKFYARIDSQSKSDLVVFNVTGQLIQISELATFLQWSMKPKL